MLKIDLFYFHFVTIVSVLIYLLLRYRNRNERQNLAKIPGPPARYPFLGNLDIFYQKGVPLSQSFYSAIIALSVLYEKNGIFKFRLGLRNVVCIFKDKYVEQMLANSVNLNKSQEYDFIHDWLGQGLLTSNTSRWKGRRKLLTPAFHFKILEDFLPIINKQSNILIDILKHQTSKEFIDISEFVTRCALDIICETAMGISIGAQIDPHQQYVKSLHILGELYIERVYQPWLWPDFIFYSTKTGKLFRNSMNILHEVTRNVIKERKSILLSLKENQDNSGKQEINKEVTNQNNDSLVYMSNKGRKRLAFLDLLLDYHIEKNSLSLEEIQEEVDTFTFAGHDTTSIGVSWALYMLGLHPTVQIKIQEELDSIFGDDINRDITPEDLKNMIYLECVIKESLRVYPSVPMIGRHITEEMQFGDYVIPKDTSVYILINRLHSTFNDPLKFDPNRFSQENMRQRSAFSYIPFSGGSRNCIGQKFAIMEEKVMLSKFFLNYNLISLDERDKILTAGEMVLRPKSALRAKIVPRKSFQCESC